MTPEGKVKHAVKAYLRNRGAYWFMPVQAGYGAPSLDFLVCYHGHFIGIETKAPGKRVTPRQRLTMEDMGNAGALVIVVDNHETVFDVLEPYFDWVYSRYCRSGPDIDRPKDSD